MANVRTLKLNLLADTTDFANGIKKASGQTNSFAKDIARNMKIATAAAGGLAVAFGVSAVKAAIDDQKAQKQLQVALKNTTKATDKQIGKVEDWISSQGRLLGVTDDELRPALAKLVRVTGDVNKSQDLLNLAMDIAAGTGKNLSSVTDALVRAQNGNLGALKKLGVPLSDATVKNKDLAKALQEADKRFHGAAEAAGDTMAGKLKKFKTAMDESKESIGYAIIQGLQPLADKWLPIVTTGVQHFIDGLTGQSNNGGLKGAIEDNQTSLYNLGQDIKGFFKYLNDHKDGLKEFATIIGSIFIGAKAYQAVSAMTGALSLLRKAFAMTTTVAATTAGAEAAATGGASLLAALPAITAIAVAFGIPALMNMFNQKPTKLTKTQAAALPGTTTGVSGTNGIPYGGNPSATGSTTGGFGVSGYQGNFGTTPRKFKQSRMGGGDTTIINLNGLVDGESARRSIVKVLQESSIRTGAINLQGSAL